MDEYELSMSFHFGISQEYYSLTSLPGAQMLVSNSKQTLGKRSTREFKSNKEGTKCMY